MSRSAREMGVEAFGDSWLGDERISRLAALAIGSRRPIGNIGSTRKRISRLAALG